MLTSRYLYFIYFFIAGFLCVTVSELNIVAAESQGRHIQGQNENENENPTSPTSLEEKEMKAQEGDAEEQYILAKYLLRDEHSKGNRERGFDWLKTAAKQGHRQAQYKIGLMYQWGDFVERDVQKAVEWYQTAAESGSVKAALSLGVLFDYGNGVPKSVEKAIKWYDIAAERGSTSAKFNLGLIYLNGRGVFQDETKAAFWFHAAAEEGHAAAQLQVATQYHDGQGVDVSLNKAIKWYKKAAEQGNVTAQSKLAKILTDGEGIPKNYEEAALWYRRAAYQGRAIAQANLGAFYLNGFGVPKNVIQAYKWLSLAAAQGNSSAKIALRTLEQDFSSEEISEAQKLASRFQPFERNSRSVSGTENDSSKIQVSNAPSKATVTRIQQDLKFLGYDITHEDGVVDSGTADAIKIFQADEGIPVDGQPSITLMAYLSEILNRSRRGASGPSMASALNIRATGTGFFVSPDGYLVTNNHVVESCIEIRVPMGNNTAKATVFGTDIGDDLALLHVQLEPVNTAKFSSEEPGLGQDIIVAGYPLRNLLGGLNVTRGEISSISGIGGDRRYFQISAPVQPGNSGGPLLDQYGSVTGVVVSKLDAKAIMETTGDIPQNVNFAIKGPLVTSFLAIHGINFSRQSISDNKPAKSSIASMAKTFTVPVECWK